MRHRISFLYTAATHKMTIIQGHSIKKNHPLSKKYFNNPISLNYVNKKWEYGGRINQKTGCHPVLVRCKYAFQG